MGVVCVFVILVKVDAVCVCACDIYTPIKDKCHFIYIYSHTIHYLITIKLIKTNNIHNIQYINIYK